MKQLVEVVEASALRKHEARVGRTEDVLVEGPSKNNAAMWSGRTGQNKLVHFSPAAGMRAGDFVPVTITAAAPHWLRGEIAGQVRAGRRRRTRIPVEVV